MIKREGYFIRISIEKDKMKERRAINSHCTLLKFIFLEQCKLQSAKLLRVLYSPPRYGIGRILLTSYRGVIKKWDSFYFSL